MYLNGFFSHTSPSTGTLVDRLRAAGLTYRVAGENLALAATPEEVHDGFMNSPGHRANILGEVTIAGWGSRWCPGVWD
jgi:uncharacterized protein YkwD